LRFLGAGWTGVCERRIEALQTEVGRMLEGGWAVVGGKLVDCRQKVFRPRFLWTGLFMMEEVALRCLGGSWTGVG